MKKEVLRRAWQKKEVFCNNARFLLVTITHSKYLNAVNMPKPKEYLKGKKFQTPYPARMRVFYADGTLLHQNATEATKDMALRGLPVFVVKSLTASDQDEILRLSSWQVAERRCYRGGDPDSDATGSGTRLISI